MLIRPNPQPLLDFRHASRRRIAVIVHQPVTATEYLVINSCNVLTFLDAFFFDMLLLSGA